MIVNSAVNPAKFQPRPYCKQKNTAGHDFPIGQNSLAFSGKCGINIGTEYTLSRKSYKFDKKLSDEQCSKLFPKGIENLHFEQGHVGDCILLAAIKALTLNKKGQEIIQRIIQVKPDGEFQVTFPGYRHTNIYPKKIEHMDEKTGVYGHSGVKVIEQAYGLLRKNTIKNNLLMLLIGKLPIDKNSLEPCCPEDVFTDLTGIVPVCYTTFPFKSTFNSRDRSRKKIEKILEKLSDNPDKYAAIAGTAWGVEPLVLKKKKKVTVKSRKTNTMRTKTVYDRFKIVEAHAYTIASVNKEKREVTLINPHDTSSTRTISYDIFFDKFKIISYVDMDKAYSKLNLA